MTPDASQYIPKVIERIIERHCIAIRLLNNFLDKEVIISSGAICETPVVVIENNLEWTYNATV